MNRILIADDVPQNLYMLETVLKSQGYSVITASNGVEALDSARKSPPDLIITDILMPVMDGFELCRLWKSDETLKHVPFVFYTATYTDLKDEQFALSLGAERFIVKPQAPEVLVEIVQDILDEMKKGRIVPGESTITEELEFMHKHNEVVLKKLEKKMLRLELEAAERKRAERQLRDHAELLDTAHEAITRVDLDGTITYWNKGSERLYGWKAEEVTGKRLADVPFKADAIQLQEALKAVKAHGEWAGEGRRVDRNGKEIFIETSWKLAYDDAGKPDSILIINIDITEKKNLESQFLRAQRLESIGTLTSGIAHDLTNMLTPIKLAVENLRSLSPSEPSAKLLDMIERNASRGADLIKRVLSFTRGIEEEHKELSIADTILDIEKIVMGSFPKSVEFQVRIPEGVWAISGNATQLHQVIMNLCVNARDAMPEGGTLTISAENVVVEPGKASENANAKAGPYVVITVSDTGTGMTPEVKERLFEPFFTTKEVGKGTGLGLSTSLGIVKGHGGCILVNSELGRGTAFKVYIPAYRIPQPITQVPGRDIPIGGGEVVLVADAEAKSRERMISLLESHGYGVLVARDGPEAISTFAQNKERLSIGLVNLDMPIIDGLETIRIIERIKPGVRIIAIGEAVGDGKGTTGPISSVRGILPKTTPSEAVLKAIYDAIHL